MSATIAGGKHVLPSVVRVFAHVSGGAAVWTRHRDSQAAVDTGPDANHIVRKRLGNASRAVNTRSTIAPGSAAAR